MAEENLKEALKSRIIKMAVAIIAFVICLGITVILNLKVSGQQIDSSEIQQVECKVTRITSHSITANPATKVHTYYASYRGKEYELYNVKTMVKEGSTVKAYLYNGGLYANMEGIKTNTGLGGIYFFFLGITIIPFYFMLLEIAYFKQEKRKVAEDKQDKRIIKKSKSK